MYQINKDVKNALSLTRSPSSQREMSNIVNLIYLNRLFTVYGDPVLRISNSILSLDSMPSARRRRKTESGREELERIE